MLSLAGVAFYNYFLRKSSLKKVFFWTALTMIAADLAQVVLVTGERLILTINQLHGCFPCKAC